jgi:DNA end-binding protein Ku
MRAMWKGAVSFGLVNVPVKLYSATENHDISFRQVHREDGGQIRYQRVCSVCGQQIAYEDVAKGYETEDGQMVVLTDEDLRRLPNQSSKEVAVEKFVPADQIDPMLLDRSYYLEPEKGAAKAYALLRDALVAADRMALVTVSIRTRMTMAVLRVRDGIIVLQTMLWPDEIRSADFANLGDVGHATDKELAMANMLVDSLAGDYDPDELEDDYALAVQDLVASKIEGAVPVAVPEAKDGSGEVVDLLEALQRSVDKAKAARGEPTSQPAASEKEEPAEAPAARTPAKRAPAKTTKAATAKAAPAKQAAAKQTPAKRAPAKKTTTKAAAKRKAS